MLNRPSNAVDRRHYPIILSIPRDWKCINSFSAGYAKPRIESGKMGVGSIRKPVDCMLAPKVIQVCEEIGGCIPVIEVYNVANRISTSINKFPGKPLGNKCNFVSSTKIENIKRNRMQSCTRTPYLNSTNFPLAVRMLLYTLTPNQGFKCT